MHSCYPIQGDIIQRQFSLVYSDWEVLLSDNNSPDSKKGPVYVKGHFLKMCCLSLNIIFCQMWFVSLMSMCKGTNTKCVGDMMPNFSPTPSM